MIFQVDMVQFEGNFERMNHKGDFGTLALQRHGLAKKQSLYNNKVGYINRFHG